MLVIRREGACWRGGIGRGLRVCVDRVLVIRREWGKKVLDGLTAGWNEC